MKVKTYCLVLVIFASTMKQSNVYNSSSNIESNDEDSIGVLKNSFNSILNYSSEIFSSLTKLASEHTENFKSKVNTVIYNINNPQDHDEKDLCLGVTNSCRTRLVEESDLAEILTTKVETPILDFYSSITNSIVENANYVKDYFSTSLSGYTENQEYSDIYNNDLNDTLNLFKELSSKNITSNLIGTDYYQTLNASFLLISNYLDTDIKEYLGQHFFNEQVDSNTTFHKLYNLLTPSADFSVNEGLERLNHLFSFISEEGGEQFTNNFSFDIKNNTKEFIKGLLEGVSKVPMRKNQCYKDTGIANITEIFERLFESFTNSQGLMEIVSNLVGFRISCNFPTLAYEMKMMMTPVGIGLKTVRIVSKMNLMFELYNYWKEINNTEMFGKCIGKLAQIVLNYHTE
jgi:hypothetical protein